MADALVKHAFVSAIPEGLDPTKIRTSNWNAALVFTAGADGDVLTRSVASATGAAWTVPAPAAAAAGTLTGATLASNVLASSLTSVGVLAGLTVTAPIAGSVTGAAGSAPANALTGTTLAAGVTGAPQTWTGLQTFNGGMALTGILSSAVNAIATTSTDGLVLQNTTPATAGVPVQLSPRLRLSGTARNSASGLSETDDWVIEVLPVTVAGATASYLRFGKTIGVGALTYPLTIQNTGLIACAGGASFAGTVSANIFNISGRNIILNGVPFIVSGFNTSPTLPGGICSNSFQVNTGATPVTNTAVINFGIAAAAGWAVHCNDLSDTVNVCQVATTTNTASFKAYSKTTGAQVAWPASAVLNFLALAY